jgi:hypothetical protein
MKQTKKVYLVVGQDGVSTAWAYGNRRSAKTEAERLNAIKLPNGRVRKEKLREFAKLAIRRPFVVLPYAPAQRKVKS